MMLADSKEFFEDLGKLGLSAVLLLQPFSLPLLFPLLLWSKKNAHFVHIHLAYIFGCLSRPTMPYPPSQVAYQSVIPNTHSSASEMLWHEIPTSSASFLLYTVTPLPLRWLLPRSRR